MKKKTPCNNHPISNSQVVDSRAISYDSIRRRRQCLVCGHRYTTYEQKAAELRLAESQMRDVVTERDSLRDTLATIYRIGSENG